MPRERSTTIGLTVAVCVLLITAVARADWQVRATKSESTADGSVIHWQTKLENTSAAASAILDCAVFNPRSATLQVIDQPELPRKELADAMNESEALAGVNGGYFDPQDAPVGLLVSRGRTLSPLRRAKLLTGVLFATKSGKLDVVRASHFRLRDQIEAAVQCGPLLVEDGKPVAGLNDSRSARRTFAAVDENENALIGVSSLISLAQLARILSQPDIAGKVKLMRALNLDGGSSSAFWFAGKNGTRSIPELKRVRDFVAVLPRTAR